MGYLLAPFLNIWWTQRIGRTTPFSMYADSLLGICGLQLYTHFADGHFISQIGILLKSHLPITPLPPTPDTCLTMMLTSPLAVHNRNSNLKSQRPRTSPDKGVTCQRQTLSPRPLNHCQRWLTPPLMETEIDKSLRSYTDIISATDSVAPALLGYFQ